MHDRALRVCHLIAGLPYGGAERMVVNVLNNLPVDHRQVVFHDRQSGGGLYSELSSDIYQEFLGLRLRYAPYYVIRLAKLLRYWKIDVLHSHMFWSNLYGSWASRIAHTPVFITSEHGDDPWKTGVHRWAERHVISPAAARRICVSEDVMRLRRDVDHIPDDKLVYLPNGTILPTAYSRQPRSADRPFTIGTVGRLIPLKDHGTLIRAVRILRDKGYKFVLYIVGDGPERGRLERMIDEERLAQCVVITGFQDDTAEWYRKFDVFVLSSVHEGQPMALLEAMAHGVAVVATQVGGIPNTVIDRREALLVKPDDPHDLCAAIESLLENEELRVRLGAEARARVSREFTVKQTCERLLELYEDAMAKSGSIKRV